MLYITNNLTFLRYCALTLFLMFLIVLSWHIWLHSWPNTHTKTKYNYNSKHYINIFNSDLINTNIVYRYRILHNKNVAFSQVQHLLIRCCRRKWYVIHLRTVRLAFRFLDIISTSMWTINNFFFHFYLLKV